MLPVATISAVKVSWDPLCTVVELAVTVTFGAGY